MAQQMQEPQLEKKQQTYRRHSWILWAVVLVVLCAIFAFTLTVLLILKSQGINQGTVTILTILSILVGTIVALLGLLFAFLQWFHSRPSHSAMPLPPSTVPHHDELTDNVGLSKSTPIDMHQEDWGEAPHIEQFYGREQERAELKQWIVDDRCRMVAVLGIGGIGKTSLTAVLAEHVKEEFDTVFWRSLQNAPPLESILQSCIQFLSHQQQADLPEDVDGQITLLIQYLREHRCLIVLDNLETILQAGNRAGEYREGFEGYSRLLHRVGEAKHQSCLFLTSREKPKEVARFEGKTSPVRALRLPGLEQIEGQEILKDKGLFGTDDVWKTLIALYAGNPLALKLAAEPIRELFGGDVANFLEKGKVIFGDMRDPLDFQFNRLSEQERVIMYWLAIEREAVSLDDLRDDIVPQVSKEELLVAVGSLRRRSMIEISGMARFTLQSVIMEYVTDELIKQVYKEIKAEDIGLFGSHALIKAQTKDYVRESQVRLILMPVTERLLTTFGKVGSEQKLKSILIALHDTHSQLPEYAAGNILNLLIQLQCDLRGYDFSDLIVQQAYLQGATLLEVNFANAHFSKVVFTDAFGSILSVVFSPNDNLIAAGTSHGEVRLWQVNGTPHLICQGHTDEIRSVAYSPNGTTIASGSDDQSIRLWEVSTGRCLKVLQGHSGWVRSVAFSPDGKILASSSEDQTIRLWEASTGQCLEILQGHTSWVRSLTFNSNGKALASGSGDQSIRLWEVSTGKCLKVLQGHSSWIWSVSFSPDGKVLASSDQSIRLWEISTGKCLKVLQGHTSWIKSIAFSLDGNTIASGGEEQIIRFWDVSIGQCLETLQGHTDWIWSVVFSSDGKILASGSEDQTIRLWEVSTGKCLGVLQGHTNRVYSIAFSPDGNVLASGSYDQTVRLWNVSKALCLKTLQGHADWVYSIAFSPDGKILASGSGDRTIRLWEVSTGQCLRTLQGHVGWVYSVAFSPDGNTIVSGSEDQTLRLWDVSTGKRLKTMKGHTNRVWSVAFNPDGNTVASGSEDGTVKLWDVQAGVCLNTMRGDRPYERMNITNVRGLSETQKATLKALGAVEDKIEALS
jgi:WD40 repeat protein